MLVFCSCEEKQPVPSHKMRAVLKDIMVLEAGSQMKYSFGLLPDEFWVKNYAYICKLHNVDTGAFKKTISFFEKKPEEFSKIMEGVITDLQKEGMNKGSKKK